MKLYIGTTNDNELYYIEFDFEEARQKQYFSLCGGTYNEPKTEKQGREDAYKTLKDADYWDDIGMLDRKSILMDFIDFDRVANHILNIDGWEDTNGEYTHFGEIENEEVYLNNGSGGQHQIKRKELKDLWISEEDFKRLNHLWDTKHLKEDKDLKLAHEVKAIFDKYPNLSIEQEVLLKFCKAIEW